MYHKFINIFKLYISLFKRRLAEEDFNFPKYVKYLNYENHINLNLFIVKISTIFS